jgi:hypothetical protein
MNTHYYDRLPVQYKAYMHWQLTLHIAIFRGEAGHVRRYNRSALFSSPNSNTQTIARNIQMMDYAQYEEADRLYGFESTWEQLRQGRVADPETAELLTETDKAFIVRALAVSLRNSNSV